MWEAGFLLSDQAGKVALEPMWVLERPDDGLEARRNGAG
jgi:hypothetical protein